VPTELRAAWRASQPRRARCPRGGVPPPGEARGDDAWTEDGDAHIAGREASSSWAEPDKNRQADDEGFVPAPFPPRTIGLAKGFRLQGKSWSFSQRMDLTGLEPTTSPWESDAAHGAFAGNVWRVHRGCTGTQNVAICVYPRGLETAWLREKRDGEAPSGFHGKEEALGSNPREGLEFSACVSATRSRPEGTFVVSKGSVLTPSQAKSGRQRRRHGDVASSAAPDSLRSYLVISEPFSGGPHLWFSLGQQRARGGLPVTFSVLALEGLRIAPRTSRQPLHVRFLASMELCHGG
jgi:hypothetical protein